MMLYVIITKIFMAPKTQCMFAGDHETDFLLKVVEVGGYIDFGMNVR